MNHTIQPRNSRFRLNQNTMNCSRQTTITTNDNREDFRDSSVNENTPLIGSRTPSLKSTYGVIETDSCSDTDVEAGECNDPILDKDSRDEVPHNVAGIISILLLGEQAVPLRFLPLVL